MKLAAFLAAILCISTLTAQGVNLPPPGLPPGAQYRVMFVTEAQQNPHFGTLDLLDALVATDATDTGLDQAVGGSQWKAVASTPGVDAGDHSGTAFPSTTYNVPIYRPDGVKVVSFGVQLWTSSLILAPPTITGSGAVNIWDVATGTGADGLGADVMCNPVPRRATWGDSSISGICFDAGSRDFCAGQSLGNCLTAPVYGISDVLTVPAPPATITDLGEGCAAPAPKSFLFFPNGFGAYQVSVGTGTFNPNVGSPIGATADDAITATNIPLGFPFPGPSGQTAATVSVDPNGRILPETAILASVPSLASSVDPVEFTRGGFDQICPWWCDFDVTAPGSGEILLATVPGESATFTWNGVAQKGGVPTSDSRLTVQCTLYADGAILFVHEAVTAFNSRGEDDALIVGVAGRLPVTLPPQVDFSEFTTSQTQAVPVFEYWSSNQFVDLTAAQAPRLAAYNLPQLGSQLWIKMTEIPSASTTVYFLLGATPTTPIDLTPVGLPCYLRVAPDVTMSAAIQSDVMWLGAPVPSSPDFIGTQLFIQGAVDGAPHAIPLFLTNALVAEVGI